MFKKLRPLFRRTPLTEEHDQTGLFPDRVYSERVYGTCAIQPLGLSDGADLPVHLHDQLQTITDRLDLLLGLLTQLYGIRKPVPFDWEARFEDDREARAKVEQEMATVHGLYRDEFTGLWTPKGGNAFTRLIEESKDAQKLAPGDRVADSVVDDEELLGGTAHEGSLEEGRDRHKTAFLWAAARAGMSADEGKAP